MVRGKFRCSSVTFMGEPKDRAANRQFVFNAIYDTSTPENERFSTATPYAKLELNVSNPEIDFTVGTEYYLDLTPVENQQPPA